MKKVGAQNRRAKDFIMGNAKILCIQNTKDFLISHYKLVTYRFHQTYTALTSRSDRIFWQDFVPSSSPRLELPIALLYRALGATSQDGAHFL